MRKEFQSSCLLRCDDHSVSDDEGFLDLKDCGVDDEHDVVVKATSWPRILNQNATKRLFVKI